MFNIWDYEDHLVYINTEDRPKGYYIKKGTPKSIRDKINRLNGSYYKLYGSKLIQGEE